MNRGEIVEFVSDDGTPTEGQPHRVIYASGRRVDVRAINERGRVFGAVFSDIPAEFRVWRNA